ncbi:gamma-glutamylcyclotransferase [Amycolatopsis acidiphila]|uniref:gamma-glutamylcyclotransferase n=1 Tax=Amycolatopsis acidiphila TaxID=715473 RepID=UPI00199DEC30|nr:gamma-glutamylcyclotransferase [Amycolatopsis acidiphila]UIJ59255.1 gamma-glutamylcyclotransferase [Amycolatopsis acidiphila]GHG79353.1 gamma-glutamylcyclotransferase [Amycolatopsis acidiphila]
MHRDGCGYALPAELDHTGFTPVLAYGSNACPSKITWLRENLGLTGDVTVLQVRCTGLAAVWAAGFRARDGQRSATLAAYPGIVETHAVWLATPEQLAVLDVCEGRGERYDLARLKTGVSLPDGTELPEVFAYVGASPARMPLLVDGAPVRTADVAQGKARSLNGVPAPSHGLDIVIV